MNKLAVLSFTILLATGINLTGIYDYSVPKIEGGSQSLSAFEGKRILVVTLPISQTASADSFLYALDTLAASHANTLKVIAVPSFEDGYLPANKSQLEQWYRSKLDTSIIISDGLYTRRSSDSQQHELFSWLTDINQNEVFNKDVSGSNFKFFIKEDGSLYGVLESQTKISSQAVNKTLTLQ